MSSSSVLPDEWSILIVESDHQELSRLKAAAIACGLKPRVFERLEDALSEAKRRMATRPLKLSLMVNYDQEPNGARMRELRALAAQEAMPVVLMTSNEDAVQARHPAAHEILLMKPVSVHTLKSALIKAISPCATDATAPHQAQSIIHANEIRHTERIGQTEVDTVLDRERIHERFGENGGALMKRVVSLFSEARVTHLQEIRDALKAGDSSALRLAAHSLKGVVGNFTQTGSFESSTQLEKMGRDGQMTGVRPLLETLEAELRILQNALETLL